jgi:hypothetical protein
MRALKLTGLAVALLFAVTLCVRAAEKEEKEVKLTGTVTCAKCDLKDTKECQTVIQVKEGDKMVTYYFAKPKGDEHKTICQKATKGSVTGVVSEKDGKKIITPNKDGVTFDKEKDK